MPNIEYLDPEIANEGSHAEAGFDLEPAHVWDYAPLKADKKYKKYFQPYKYVRYPADFYHANGETKRVHNDAEAAELGCRPHRNTWICEGEWHDEEAAARAVKVDFKAAGKNLVAASNTGASQNELLMQLVKQLSKGQETAPTNDVLLVLTGILQQMQIQNGQKPAVVSETKAEPALPEIDEKALLIEAAASRDIKVDKRWSIDRIKSELDKVA
jgi:hypothetical protein